MATKRAMGALESEILGHLWSVDVPLTPGDVMERMKQPPSYNTVMTIMARLWKKGLASRERRGRAYEYRPVMTEADFAAGRMRATLDAAGDREAALSRFVGTLGRRDERLLRRLLTELDRKR